MNLNPRDRKGEQKAIVGVANKILKTIRFMLGISNLHNVPYDGNIVCTLPVKHFVFAQANFLPDVLNR